MAVQVTVKQNKPRAVTIGGRATHASAQGWTKSDTHLAQTSVQAVLEELANRFYQKTTAPSLGVNEGDLWYDLANSQLKLYNGTSWGDIGVNLSDAIDDLFKFSTSAILASGNVAEFKNNTTTVFSIQHDGVVVLKEQSSAPTAVANGLYSDGTDMYYGKT